MPAMTLIPRGYPEARTAIAVLSLSLPLLLASVDASPASQPAQSAAIAAAGSTAAEIDRDVWVPVAASVANDDIVAMGRVYHPTAVLVTKAGTKPIAAALDGWGKDIVVAKKNGVRATVEFRFSSPPRRRHDGVRDRHLQVLDHGPGRRRHAALCGTGSPAGEARRQVAHRDGTSARVDHRDGVERLAADAVSRSFSPRGVERPQGAAARSACQRSICGAAA